MCILDKLYFNLSRRVRFNTQRRRFFFRQPNLVKPLSRSAGIIRRASLFFLGVTMGIGLQSFLRKLRTEKQNNLLNLNPEKNNDIILRMRNIKDKLKSE